MSKAIVVAMLAAAGCATPTAKSTSASASTNPPATASTTAPPPPAPMDAWKQRPVDQNCQRELGALGRSQFEQLTGLPKCGRVDAEKALGASGDLPSRFEQLGEYRTYPNASGTVFVWFLTDDIRVMQLLHPKLAKPLAALLGPPETKVKSSLSQRWDQWVYAKRGLAAHVDRQSGEVVTLYVYRPTTVDEFLKSDLARIAKSEAPLEDLK